MVAKKAVSKKPVMKKSASDSSPPKATGKAVSGAETRRMYKENIQYFGGMIDSAMDIGSDSSSPKLRKQADALIEKYYYEGNHKRGSKGDPYAGVSQSTANALSREYNILMKVLIHYYLYLIKILDK